MRTVPRERDSDSPVMKPRRFVEPPNLNDPDYNWIVSGEPHKHLTATVRKLVQDQQGRLWNNTRLMSLYANQDLLSYGAGLANGTSNGARPQATSDMPRQTINLAKVYGDTLAGKLVQSNSKVTCLSSGGDWKKFRLARKLDKALEGEFRRGRLYEAASQVAIDAINTGTGYLHVYTDEKNRINFERWFPNEVFVDSLEAAYGQPTMMFRQRFIKRENLFAMWPDKKETIMNAGSGASPGFGWTVWQPGMVEIFEGWALPLGNRPGRHVLCVSSGCLVDEKWESEHFPVAVFKAGDLPIGWYGQGLLEHAAGSQIFMNRILNIMAKSAELGIAPFWVAANGSELDMQQLSNVEGHIMTSSGEAPQWVTNPPFHPAALTYLDFHQRSISTVYGINDIEAAGNKGYNRVDSDPALQSMQDMWMARHMILLKNWSDFFFLDVAERTVDQAKRIAKRKGSYPVQTTSNGRADLLDWADFLVLEENEIVLQMATMSLLPTEPGQKLARILQMKNEGLISPEETAQLLQGPPDLDYITAHVAAVSNDADRVIEELNSGKASQISEAQQLEDIIPKVEAAALVALDRNAPDNVLRKFEDWIARAFVKARNNQQMAAIAAAGGGQNGDFGPSGSGLGAGPAGQIGSGLAGGAPTPAGPPEGGGLPLG